MAKQKVFVPVPVSERLPKFSNYVSWGWSKDNRTIYGKLEKNMYVRSYSNSRTGLFDVTIFDYWLEERELNVLTDEELQGIVQGAKLAETFSVDDHQREIVQQLNHDKS